MRRIASVVFVVVSALVLCAVVIACSGSSTGSSSASPQRAMSKPVTDPPLKYSPVSNGRAIFDTGTDLDGVKIVAQPAPLFSSCEACHRANGSGGRRFTDGATSADLRHQALVVEQTHPYTLALLERAISTGIDNEGKPLDKVMPHWRMSKRDLHDVAEFVLFNLK